MEPKQLRETFFTQDQEIRFRNENDVTTIIDTITSCPWYNDSLNHLYAPKKGIDITEVQFLRLYRKILSYHLDIEESDIEKKYFSSSNIDHLFQGQPNLEDPLHNLVDSIIRRSYNRQDKTVVVKLYYKQRTPRYEIFMLGPEIAGVHIRFSKVARGGIRMSQEKIGYYAECLSLARVQHKKNLFCTADGAKGCLYTDIEDKAKAYKIYLRAILSVIDNNPLADDPVFLGAADVGTGNFLDIAQDIARQHDFWMQDAVIAGSNNGFNHRRTGITARGAICSLDEMIKVSQLRKDVYDVIVVGSPRGDVVSNFFRNFKTYHLTAAIGSDCFLLNHAGISLNSIIEELITKKQSWHEIQKEGVTILKRGLSSYDLQEPESSYLGLASGLYSEQEIIRSILSKKENDIIYFGGIGTYVASAQEASSNPELISGNQINSRMIVEGANLACTKGGRKEFSGLVNSDFFDNGAAVMLSDYEVNMKMALSCTNANNINISTFQEQVVNMILQEKREQNKVITRIQKLNQVKRAIAVEIFYIQGMKFKNLIRQKIPHYSYKAVLKPYFFSYFPSGFINLLSSDQKNLLIETHPFREPIISTQICKDLLKRIDIDGNTNFYRLR